MSTPRRKALRVRPVRPSDARRAAQLVIEYHESGNGSNAGKWERVEFLISACLTVIATGDSVQVPASMIPAGGSPVYNRLHRPLSSGAVRPYWASVRIDILRDVQVLRTLSGGIINVDGEPTSTAKDADTVSAYISPVS